MGWVQGVAKGEAGLLRSGARGAALAWISLLIGAILGTRCALAEDELPACLDRSGTETIETRIRMSAPSSLELLARLAYAEGRSTGFPEDPGVYTGIAWGVINRVRLGEASAQMRRRYGEGVAGVIFRKGQFNPAISPRSPYSRAFLCPGDRTSWRLATEAASKAIQGAGNPFIQTPWEQLHHLSLVVNFYYPASSQAKGPLPPWEGNPTLSFIGPVPLEDGILGPERIRFYRLAQPPADVRLRSDP